jgi:hypothetical protein
VISDPNLGSLSRLRFHFEGGDDATGIFRFIVVSATTHGKSTSSMSTNCSRFAQKKDKFLAFSIVSQPLKLSKREFPRVTRLDKTSLTIFSDLFLAPPKKNEKNVVCKAHEKIALQRSILANL